MSKCEIKRVFCVNFSKIYSRDKFRKSLFYSAGEADDDLSKSSTADGLCNAPLICWIMTTTTMKTVRAEIARTITKRPYWLIYFNADS